MVVFFPAPLQHFAERIAGVAMPNTHNSPESAAYRKMQVYEAAVAEAVERDMLAGSEAWESAVLPHARGQPPVASNP